MEKFDLYDKSFNKLNKTMVKGEKEPKNCYRFVVHLCIFNSDNEMLIAQRNEQKKSYPNYWAFTSAGSVISGETSEDGIKRETLEEIGLDISNYELRPFVTVHYENGFHDIYILHQDVDINELIIQESEVKDVKWASKNEIKEMIDKSEFMPFQDGLIDLLFAMHNKRGITKN